MAAFEDDGPGLVEVEAAAGGGDGDLAAFAIDDQRGVVAADAQVLAGAVGTAAAGAAVPASGGAGVQALSAARVGASRKGLIRMGTPLSSGCPMLAEAVRRFYYAVPAARS